MLFWRQIQPVQIVLGTIVRVTRADVHFGPGEKSGWRKRTLGVRLRWPRANAVGTSAGRSISAPEAPAAIRSRIRTAKARPARHPPTLGQKKEPRAL